jgi:hypothetical protein
MEKLDPTGNAIDLLTTVIYAATNNLTLDEARDALQQFLNDAASASAKRIAEAEQIIIDRAMACSCAACSRPVS